MTCSFPTLLSGGLQNDNCPKPWHQIDNVDELTEDYHNANEDKENAHQLRVPNRGGQISIA